MSTTLTPPLEEWIFLNGRPPLGDFLGFVKASAADEAAIDIATLSNEWRDANAHIGQLEITEAGWADNPTIGPIPAELQHRVSQVQADPMFRKVFEIAPVSFGMVELDRLVVYQKHINVSYATELKTRLGTTPSPDDIFTICLPIDHPQPPITRMRVADNSFMFVSPSMDLRFIESEDFDAERVNGYNPRGPSSGIIGIVVGFGSNYLNALLANNRLILNNGSHRAYALRDLGVTHVPCIIQHINHQDELALICPEAAKNPQAYLGQTRPSVLKDYFDPLLIKAVPVRRKFRQVKVTFGIERTDVPGV